MTEDGGWEEEDQGSSAATLMSGLIAGAVVAVAPIRRPPQDQHALSLAKDGFGS